MLTGQQISVRLGSVLGSSALAAVFLVGLFVVQLPQPSEPMSTVVPQGLMARESAVKNVQAAGEELQARFELCGKVRVTCVVDGDTFWLDGVKVRIADIDTPEVSRPQCEQELALGNQATNRLVELMNAGPFELHTSGDRDEDRFGRKLRVVVRNGSSLGDQLVAEGLARKWTGRREPWC